ncbi:hypothetical protein BOTBODRAFT_136526 [Botryobasidium botryosum FD-172 SS1]|uniref:Protein kinase domain-containing protein n=1 Tax=Botryobasidium botryosum (strain FD-172 SS1) TaxID=930990 RepID=A0A067M542_BOTB1|nr:hypothetical protein BOTBODRAFT_136526 [Botryobasidium botryosum FD-172 SS1]
MLQVRVRNFPIPPSCHRRHLLQHGSYFAPISPRNLTHTCISILSYLCISMANDSPSGLDYLERLPREERNAGHKTDELVQRLLRRALVCPDPPMVRLLVNLGARVDERGKDECQPLHIAARHMGAGALSHSFDARPEIMRTLLDAGAKVDARDKYGDTPLSLAMHRGLASSVRFLLSVGADPTACGQNGCPVPQSLIDSFSCASEADAVAALLTTYEDVNAPAENGSRSLERAAWLGSPAAVKALLRAGADPNLPGRGGMRAIHFATVLMCHPDGEEAVAALLEAGANLNVRDDINDVTPLTLAASTGSPAAVLALLEAGANPSTLDTWGRTPLHYAAQLMSDPRGHEALAALIKAAPTSLNFPSKNGLTPLRAAAVLGSPAAVRFLLNAGADPDVGGPYNDDKLVYFAAQMMRHRDGTDVIGAKLDMGCDVLTPGHTGISLRQFALSTDSLPLIKTVLGRESNHPDTPIQTKMRHLRELLQAANGLRYLHARTPAFVHGDLKAANVLVSQEGEVRIADFGLSRWAIKGGSHGYSTTWRIAGNARWQAPELFQGTEDGEPAQRTTESDMFAFGRFIFEIYTGEFPFFYLSDQTVLFSLARGTLQLQRPTGPEAVARGLNDGMWQLIMDCCHEEPARRLTVQELIAQLKKF